MYVWFVSSFDEKGFVDKSEPFFSAEKAMNDIEFRHINWNHIEIPKFGGAVMEHWQAEYEGMEFVLDKEYVIGSDDE